MESQLRPRVERLVVRVDIIPNIEKYDYIRFDEVDRGPYKSVLLNRVVAANARINGPDWMSKLGCQ